ncbi:Ig-like domain-containing protein, partial [Octadecabacter sp.]|nr:Ig-like domain-containing protein [Octadecabacter sp.]
MKARIGIIFAVLAGAFATYAFAEDVESTLALTDNVGEVFYSPQRNFGNSLWESSSREDVLAYFTTWRLRQSTGGGYLPFPYNIVSFTPSVSGAYIVSIKDADQDVLLYFYEGDFDVTQLEANFLSGNDDYNTGFGKLEDAGLRGAFLGGNPDCGGEASLCPATSVPLSAGQCYSVVVSTYTTQASPLSGLTASVNGPGTLSINNGDCTSNIAADVIAPTFTFNPVNAATAVAVNSNITVTASEAIRLVDNSAVTDANVGTLITLKDTDVNGAVIPSTATISGNVITINPTADFSSLQQVYVAINGAAVEDTSDNAGASANATFTTADTSAPTLTSSTPADDATGVAVG